jgi:hypothetical protein
MKIFFVTTLGATNSIPALNSASYLHRAISESFMSVSSPQEITQLLVAWNKGDVKALEQLAPLIHIELHRLARRQMAGERPGHILQTTALVNEAYLRLIDWRDVEWRDRAHFFGLAAQIMRRVLVDFARARRTSAASEAPTWWRWTKRCGRWRN